MHTPGKLRWRTGWAVARQPLHHIRAQEFASEPVPLLSSKSQRPSPASSSA